MSGKCAAIIRFRENDPMLCEPRGVNAEFTSAAVRNDLARDGSW